jgi:leukotriene-A4 hydrolase
MVLVTVIAVAAVLCIVHAAEPYRNTHSLRRNHDPNSVANFMSFRTKHIELDWDVNFDSSQITGSVTLTLERQTDKENVIRLDCSHLQIRSVKNAISGASMEYTVDPHASLFGGSLEINVFPNKNLYCIQYLIGNF